VVHVEIDERDTIDAVPLEDARGDRYVIERTKALSVIGKCVMETAAYVN